tara:strand:+ start:220 stop:1569 length:1350 start_codon:yes stop_codon:yes gene_type:complete
MNLKEVISKKLYKEYSLEIPFEEINNEINKKIANLIPTVTIPGFRKGKAPISIVRKKYEDNVLNEVVQNVIDLNTSNLIKEKKFNLFRQPKVDLKDFEKNKPIKLIIKIDLQPEIKLLDFKKITLNKYEIKFSKKDLENQFKKFVGSQKSYKKITNNRHLKKTDRVFLNFDTSNKDIPEYLRSQKNIPIDTDIDQEILPGINKTLISQKLKQGDKKQLKFDLSKVLKNENFKEVSYEFQIITIEEKIKFKVDEEYLKKNGFKSENQLREILEKNLTDQYNQSIKQIEKKQLMDILDKKYIFDLPEGIIEDDFREIWNRLLSAKKEGTLDNDDKSLTDEDLKKRYKKISQRRVKLGVLLQFISKEEKINLSENDLSRGIMQYAGQYPGQEKQIIDYLKKNPSAMESIRAPLLEEKITDFIISKAKIINKKIDEEQHKKLEEETFNIKKER